LKPEVGYTTVPTILSCKAEYTEWFSNYSTIKEPTILDVSELEKIYIPVDEKEIISKGLMPLNLEKISYYHDVAGDTFDMTGLILVE
jgi:hypothetical protein